MAHALHPQLSPCSAKLSSAGRGTFNGYKTRLERSLLSFTIHYNQKSVRFILFFIHKVSKVGVTNTLHYLKLETKNATMIPVTSREHYFVEYPRYQTMYRQVWLPASVALRRRCQPLPSPPPAPRSSYTSADEICAANVLLNLTPQDAAAKKAPGQSSPPTSHELFQPPPSLMSSPVPESIAVPSSYARRWEHVYSFGKESKQESSPSQVSDHSAGEGSSSEDESSVADDSSFSGSKNGLAPKSHSTCQNGFQGSVSLALPEDADVLSPLHCFMRRYCVEVFSASPEDISTPRYGKSHGVKVIVGQAGIRCLYCKHRAPGKRPERAVCYPSSLRNIYHSIETWQRRHSLVCSDIPAWVRKSIVELMESSKSRAGGRRQYWEDSARRLGMVDTEHGVRFSRVPGDLGKPQHVARPAPDAPASPIVKEGDKELVTDYLYLLMDQMQTCKFAEEDRTGGRSKIKDNEVGFPGMQCKHCQGKAGFGRYFPTTANALALANSDRNIFNHVQKCRRCPQHIKSNLTRLSKDQTQAKNRRGLRKMFFQRVWRRMHGSNT